MRLSIYDPSGSTGDWKQSVLACCVAAPSAYTRTLNTIEANAVGALPNLDTSAVPAVGSRFLLALAPANADNCIWRVTSLGSAGTKWTAVRDYDADCSAAVTAGMRVPVEAGDVYGGRLMVLTTTGTIDLNTTPLLFVDGGGMANVTAALEGTVNAFGATNGQLLGSDGATAGGVWRNDLNIQPGAITAPTNPTINLGTGTLAIGGAITKTHATDQFTAATVAPVMSQIADSTAGVTADNYTIQAQPASDAGGPARNVGGTLNLYAGNAAGPLASIGGGVLVQAGNATAAGVGSNGGSVSLTAGTGATNGCIYAGWSGATYGAAGEWRTPDTFRWTTRTGAVDQAVISSSGTTVTVGGAPGVGTTRPVQIDVGATTSVIAKIGGTARLTVGDTVSKLEASALWCDGTTGATPTSGAGTRLMWIPGKTGAIRAGVVTGTLWDSANIGVSSAAFGTDTKASGQQAFACGDWSTASGTSSLAAGSTCTASGAYSLATGQQSVASLRSQVACAGSAFAAPGDAQRSSVSLMRSSTDAGAVELTLTGAAPAAVTRLTIASGKTISFIAKTVARCTAGTDVGASASWYQEVTVGNVGGTTALVGTNGFIGRNAALAVAANVATPYTATADDAGLLAMTLTWAADDANDCIAPTFVGHIGAAANTWHVHCAVEPTSEVA